MTHHKGAMAFWIFLGLLMLPQDGVEELLQQAGERVESYRYAEALALYKKVLEKRPDEFEAVTGAAYCYGWVGKFAGSEEKRRRLYGKTHELAKRAVAMKPEHPEALFSLAWALGAKARIVGARERVALAREMKDVLDKVLERNPGDHRAWFVLGHWRYEVATASFLERTAASLLSEGLPQVSLEESAAAYRKAVRARPDSILYRYELARALQEAGQKQQAAEQYEMALGLEPKTPEDPTLLARCRYQANRLR